MRLGQSRSEGAANRFSRVPLSLAAMAPTPGTRPHERVDHLLGTPVMAAALIAIASARAPVGASAAVIRVAGQVHAGVTAQIRYRGRASRGAAAVDTGVSARARVVASAAVLGIRPHIRAHQIQVLAECGAARAGALPGAAGFRAGDVAAAAVVWIVPDVGANAVAEHTVRIGTRDPDRRA